MFSSGFSGGYNQYADRSRRVEKANAERTKSQRISDATKGKKKKRKPENKGKHRKQDAVIKGSGQVVQQAPLSKGGSASQNVVVLAGKAPNRKGAGRPKTTTGPRSLLGGGGSGLESAFKGGLSTGQKEEEKRKEKEDERATERRREARDQRIRDADIAERRRERGERQRQFNVSQQRYQNEQRQQAQNLAQQIVRETNVRAEAERVRVAERREELQLRRDELAQRAAAGPQQPIINVDAGVRGPLIEQGAIQFAPQTNFDNIGNPVINVGQERGRSRRRQRVRRGGGRGGGRATTTEDDSDDDQQPPSASPTPTPRTRRAAQRQARTPTAPQPTTEAEEQSVLQQGAGALLGLAQTGASTIGGGLARVGGGFVGGVGGAISEQLPTAETIGEVAGRGVVSATSATGRAIASGATTIAQEALRPTQEETFTQRELQSASEGEGGGSGELSIADKIRIRKEQDARRIAELRREPEPQPEVSEPVQRARVPDEQDALLQDIKTNIGQFAGQFVPAKNRLQEAAASAGQTGLNLVGEALGQVGLPQLARTSTPKITTPEDALKDPKTGERITSAFVSERTGGTLGVDDEFSSEGEGAGDIFSGLDSGGEGIIDDYTAFGGGVQLAESPPKGADATAAELASFAIAPTPAQVALDIASGTEGIYRQVDRVVKTGGDVLEDPVEAPESPTTIQRREDEKSARELQAKLDAKRPPTQRQQIQSLRPIVVLSGDTFVKPSTSKATKSKKVIQKEYASMGIQAVFGDASDETRYRDEGREIIKPKPLEEKTQQRGRSAPIPVKLPTSSEEEGGFTDRSGQAYQARGSFDPRGPPQLSPPASGGSLSRSERDKAFGGLYPSPSKEGGIGRLLRARDNPNVSESEGETSPDEEPKFRDVRKLSPKQLVKTAEQLQRQQIDVDRRLEEASGRPARQPNLLKEAISSSSDEGERFDVFGAEGDSPPEEGAEDYNLGQYGAREDY